MMEKENNNQPLKILYRSNTNRIIFGVCGGLGEYFNIDPVLFRIIFILLTFGGGAGVLFYIILSIMIPRNPSGLENSKPNPMDLKQKINDLASEFTGK